jgi:hypothetical protein
MKSNVPFDEIIQEVLKQKTLIDHYKSHPKRKIAESFLYQYIRVIDESLNIAVLKSDWTDNILLPEKIIDQDRFGQLQKISLDKTITPELKKLGYLKKRSNEFYKTVVATGSTIRLQYDTSLVVKCIRCNLHFGGDNWWHAFHVTFNKGYSHPDFGVMSIEHLHKAINNHICILQAVEKEILSGLDKIYHED